MAERDSDRVKKPDRSPGGNKANILLVEDVSSFRYVIQNKLPDHGITVAGHAMEPAVAVRNLFKYDPDVVVLSLSMNSMDALEFLSRLMKYHPLPVVAITADMSLQPRALELGARSCIKRPESGSENEFMSALAGEILQARQVKESLRKLHPVPALSLEREILLFDVVPMKNPQKRRVSSNTVIAIGSSTGGTQVIEKILSSLREDCPAIVIVQHMPENFTPLFADRLNRLAPMYVKEAEDGDILYRGYALLAPGNRHLMLDRGAPGFIARVTMDPPVNLFRPSVDVLFHSVAKIAGPVSVAVMLTGMGGDGARGMLAIHESGGITIAQDEMSSAVFGMPREAIRMGAARHVRDIDGIIQFLNSVS